MTVTMERAKTAPAVNGQPAWHGQFRTHDGKRWMTVRNHSLRLPISYTTPEAALKAAAWTGAAWRAAARSTSLHLTAEEAAAYSAA